MSDPKQTNADALGNAARAKRRRALITGFPVVLDACVLANSTIRDFVLWAAYLALYRPTWTLEILSEVKRTLRKFGIAETRIEYTISQMTESFPEAEVAGYEALVPAMTNSVEDRHVLAAGIIGKAQLIVTENVKDFPDESLRPYRIEVSTADDFLRDLLDIDPERMIEVLTTLSEARKMPPRSVEELLTALVANGCPGFAGDLRVVLKSFYADS